MRTKTTIGMLANLKLEKRDLDKRIDALWGEIKDVCSVFEAKHKGRLGTGWTSEQMIKNGFKVEGITLTHFRLMWDQRKKMNAYAVAIEKRIKHLRRLMKTSRRKK